MLVSQFIDPADLATLTARQRELLNSVLAGEIASSPVIRKELGKKVAASFKAIKAQTKSKPSK